MYIPKHFSEEQCAVLHKHLSTKELTTLLALMEFKTGRAPRDSFSLFNWAYEHLGHNVQVYLDRRVEEC